MLGKRARPIRRTTSLSQLRTMEPQMQQQQWAQPLPQSNALQGPFPQNSNGYAAGLVRGRKGDAAEGHNLMVIQQQQQQILVSSSASGAMKSRMERSSSAISPIGFLDMCFYCRRRLCHAQDIYMYRGDRAFCSVECRQLQIGIDEKTEKCSMMNAIKKDITAPSSNHNKGISRHTEAMA